MKTNGIELIRVEQRGVSGRVREKSKKVEWKTELNIPEFATKYNYSVFPVKFLGGTFG